MRHEDRVKALEERYPTAKKKEYLTHQSGSAKKRIQKGWEGLHTSGLKDKEEERDVKGSY